MNLRILKVNKIVLRCFLLVCVITSCKKDEKKLETQEAVFVKYDETAEILEQQKHNDPKMQFKVLQSLFLDKNAIFKPFEEALAGFSEKEYELLKPIILEQDIPFIQQKVSEGDLTYEKLTLFYLYRIRKFESDSTLYLNSIIDLNPNVLEEARAKDKNRPNNISHTSLYGLPILLKDNLNTANMSTTAGAFVLQHNNTEKDAFVVEKLKENGALILGKLNLSEWAYFFCNDCPYGYSAMGGQTLNPYGRKQIESGGSSSGSGVATAANFAVATIGTETSGSITSPSSVNAVVGLKPTIGVLSRAGIIPISSTLDTPGPMTKSVIDNIIIFNAMLGKDINDAKSIDAQDISIDAVKSATIKDKRLGYFSALMQDSIYKSAVKQLEKFGAELIEINPEDINLDDFITLLNLDMKTDLEAYLSKYASKNIEVKNIQDIIDFNKKDTLRFPYGQELFKGIVEDSTTLEELVEIKNRLKKDSRTYLGALETKNLDAILSLNYTHVNYAALAEYPTLVVPLGYDKEEPVGLTFIGKPLQEQKLFELAYAFEQLTKARKMPKNYQ